jgi:hypothetical protein
LLGDTQFAGFGHEARAQRVGRRIPTEARKLHSALDDRAHCLGVDSHQNWARAYAGYRSAMAFRCPICSHINFKDVVVPRGDGYYRTAFFECCGLYSIDASSSGFGIYLVLWFGHNPRTAPNGQRPTSASNMFVALRQSLRERSPGNRDLSVMSYQLVERLSVLEVES